jgi:hypothetical protein
MAVKIHKSHGARIAERIADSVPAAHVAGYRWAKARPFSVTADSVDTLVSRLGGAPKLPTWTALNVNAYMAAFRDGARAAVNA